MGERGWRNVFGRTDLRADDADDEDEGEYEAEDPMRNLDISQRPDNAIWTRTPFTIMESQKRAKELREQAKQSQGPFGPVPREKTKEELLAQQEEDDRRGGGNIEPAVQQPKASRENTNNRGGWTRQYRGWVNGQGQPVSASKPPGKKQTNIMDALQKLDKAPKGKGKKRKAGADDEPESSTTRKASPPPAPAPKPRPKPKTIAERLDEVEKGIQAKKAKTTIEEKGEPNPKSKIGTAIQSKATATTKGQKVNGKKDDDNITFGRIPFGAAANDKFPIVKGLEKMKTLPTAKKTVVNKSSSSPTSPVDPIPSFDFAGMLLEVDRASDERRQDRLRDDNASPLDKIMKDNDDIIMLDEPTSQAQPASTSTRVAGRNGTSDSRAAPSLDRAKTTEPTDTYLTPHHPNHQPSGNPSTITHLSDNIPKFSDDPSSSSQLPYSSPALDKARRQDGLARPRPIRDASRDIVKLESMAVDYTPPPKKEIGGKVGREFVPPAPTKPVAGFRLAPQVIGQRFDTGQDVKPKLEQGEEEWSTLSKSKPRFGGMSLTERANAYRYQEPATPSHKVPLFRQPQGNVQQKPSSRLTTFKPRPPLPSVAQHEYTLAPVPNGAQKPTPTYHVDEMQWTGQQRRTAAQQAPPRQEPWVREAQQEYAGNKRGRGEDTEEGDWKDQWVRQNRRGIEENPHKRYAYQRDPPRRDVGGGRAFAL